MWRPEFALLAFQSQSMCALFFVNVLYGNIRLRGRLRAIHFQSWQACNVHKLFTGNSTLAAHTNTHTHTYTGWGARANVWRESVRARAYKQLLHKHKPLFIRFTCNSYAVGYDRRRRMACSIRVNGAICVPFHSAMCASGLVSQYSPFKRVLDNIYLSAFGCK